MHDAELQTAEIRRQRRERLRAGHSLSGWSGLSVHTGMAATEAEPPQGLFAAPARRCEDAAWVALLPVDAAGRLIRQRRGMPPRRLPACATVPLLPKAPERTGHQASPTGGVLRQCHAV